MHVPLLFRTEEFASTECGSGVEVVTINPRSRLGEATIACLQVKVPRSCAPPGGGNNMPFSAEVKWVHVGIT
jgi:hypothetical protein